MSLEIIFDVINISLQIINKYNHLFVILFLQVSLVGQEPVLFAGTVEENITYGLTDTPMEAVVQAATKANAHDFITILPKGYETSNYCVFTYNSAVWYL